MIRKKKNKGHRRLSLSEQIRHCDPVAAPERTTWSAGREVKVVDAVAMLPSTVRGREPDLNDEEVGRRR